MIWLLDNYKSALKTGNCGSLVNSLGIISLYLHIWKNDLQVSITHFYLALLLYQALLLSVSQALPHLILKTNCHIESK